LTFGNLTGVLAPLSGKKFVSEENDEEKAILEKLRKEVR
jgi:hypothetical protein